MSQQIDAIYDSGILRPLEPLALPVQAQVKVTVDVHVTSVSSQASKNANNSDCECRSEWTDEKNVRRVALIDKLIQHSLTADETAELDQLTEEMRRQFDTEEFVPTEGARQLHGHLLNLSDSEPPAR